MAYAEKRGRTWRVKYKRPDGSWDSESGFETKEQALNWGRDQEADVRRRVWTDPHAGDVTLAEWINERWWPGQDLSLRTRSNYRYVINNYLIPEFGERPLNSLTSPSEINGWENQLRRRVPAVAAAARGRLTTILQDAVDEELIKVNPAIRARHRGRKSGKGRKSTRMRKRQQLAITPLQALLLAERCAMLTGRDDEFVMVITMAYTGMRYGETIGLAPDLVTSDRITLPSQLVEESGRFYRLPPKDDSRRNIDLPPFLGELLATQKRSVAERRCAHAAYADHGNPDEEPCPGGLPYLWLGPGGGHPRNSNFARRAFIPATWGWYPKRAKRRDEAAPVLVDVATCWPGRPLPAWPAAEPGQPFTPPWGRGNGIPRVDLDRVHPASWLPLAPGLTPHGLRHAHNTWMIEDDIPEVLRHDRLGHQMDGIKAVYSHVSRDMRARLAAALERRWNEALAARARIVPESPSPVTMLNTLLDQARGDAES